VRVPLPSAAGESRVIMIVLVTDGKGCRTASPGLQVEGTTLAVVLETICRCAVWKPVRSGASPAMLE
jgi:hypothetical protein